MNASYYDPANGRFISQDSYRGEMNDPGQWHLYVYCANNPINYTDPSGHSAVITASKIGFNLYRVAKAKAAIGILISSSGTILVFVAIIATCYVIKAGIKYSKVKAEKKNNSKSKEKASKKSKTSSNKEPNIPKSLKKKDGRVDLDKFKNRLPKGQGDKGPNGWHIVKDKGANGGTAKGTHGGSYWKLLNPALERIATLGVNGEILRG